MNKTNGIIFIVLLILAGVLSYIVFIPTKNGSNISSNNPVINDSPDNLDAPKNKEITTTKTVPNIIPTSQKGTEVLSLFYIALPKYDSEYQQSSKVYMINYNKSSIIFRDYTDTELQGTDSLSAGQDIVYPPKEYKIGMNMFTGYDYYIGDSTEKDGTVYTIECKSRKIAIHIPTGSEKDLDLSTFICK
jgi:hypothetical protein